MPDFTKSFRLLLDADTKGAVDGLGHFSEAAKKADTTTQTAGKGISASIGDIAAKTTVGQKAMGAFGLSAGQMGTLVTGAAGVAGVAIAKFALSGAAQFGSLGESVQKFATVAGTTNDVASRFVAVADDYGVSAESLSGAVGKLGKGLGANVHELDAYGVAVVYAKDGTVDLAQTTFNVIEAYNATADPTKKAELGTKAFGKSYQDLIPLITQGSSAIKSSFKDVSDAQLFDDAKIEKAQDYRLAMDTIHDSLRDVSMEIGQQVVPIIVEFAGEVDDLSTAFGKLNKVIPGTGLGDLIHTVEGLINPVKGVTDQFGKAKDAVEDMAGAGPKAVNIQGELATTMMLAAAAAQTAVMAHDDLADADKRLYVEQARVVVSAGDLGKATDDLIKKYQGEQAAILDTKNAMDDSIGSALDAQQATLDQSTAVDTYNKSLKNSKLTAGEHKQAFLDVENQILDTSKTLGDYAVNQEKASGRVMTAQEEAKVKTDAQIVSLQNEAATLDPNGDLFQSIQQWIAELQKVPKSINTDFSISGNSTTTIGVNKRSAAGGPLAAGEISWVGEQGPELFVSNKAGTIIPNNRLSAMGVRGTMPVPVDRTMPSGSPSAGAAGTRLAGAPQRFVTINNYFTVSPTADKASIGQAIAESLKAYERVSGPGWRN